jgi:hypothetical protein
MMSLQLYGFSCDLRDNNTMFSCEGLPPNEPHFQQSVARPVILWALCFDPCQNAFSTSLKPESVPQRLTVTDTGWILMEHLG